MEQISDLKIASTNQDYRQSLVDSTINIMKSNKYEYSKQTNHYIPESFIEKSNLVRNFSMLKFCEYSCKFSGLCLFIFC